MGVANLFKPKPGKAPPKITPSSPSTPGAAPLTQTPSSPSPSPIANPGPQPAPTPQPALSPVAAGGSVATETDTDTEGGGPCDCPGQKDSAGKRCGGRCAQLRDGGREPSCGGSGALENTANELGQLASGDQSLSQTAFEIANQFTAEVTGSPLTEILDQPILTTAADVGIEPLFNVPAAGAELIGVGIAQAQNAADSILDQTVGAAFATEAETGSTLAGLDALVGGVGNVILDVSGVGSLLSEGASSVTGGSSGFSNSPIADLFGGGSSTASGPGVTVSTGQSSPPNIVAP